MLSSLWSNSATFLLRKRICCFPVLTGRDPDCTRVGVIWIGCVQMRLWSIYKVVSEVLNTTCTCMPIEKILCCFADMSLLSGSKVIITLISVVSAID